MSKDSITGISPPSPEGTSVTNRLKVEQMDTQQYTDLEDTSTLKQMRWVFLIFVITWLLAAMILPVVAFCLTMNPISFTFFGTLAPPIGLLYLIARYLFRRKRDYDLAEMRIQSAAEQQYQKKRVP